MTKTIPSMLMISRNYDNDNYPDNRNDNGNYPDNRNDNDNSVDNDNPLSKFFPSPKIVTFTKLRILERSRIRKLRNMQRDLEISAETVINEERSEEHTKKKTQTRTESPIGFVYEVNKIITAKWWEHRLRMSLYDDDVPSLMPNAQMEITGRHDTKPNRSMESAIRRGRGIESI